jgi:hypothetical protein
MNSHILLRRGVGRVARSARRGGPRMRTRPVAACRVLSAWLELPVCGGWLRMGAVARYKVAAAASRTPCARFERRSAVRPRMHVFRVLLSARAQQQLRAFPTRIAIFVVKYSSSASKRSFSSSTRSFASPERRRRRLSKRHAFLLLRSQNFELLCSKLDEPLHDARTVNATLL